MRKQESWIGNCPKCRSAYRTYAPADTSKPLEFKCPTHGCAGKVVMTPIEGFPDHIEETWRADAGWQRPDDAEARLEELREAVRNVRDAKGRFHTQLAVERLIALLPEADNNQHDHACQ